MTKPKNAATLFFVISIGLCLQTCAADEVHPVISSARATAAKAGQDILRIMITKDKVDTTQDQNDLKASLEDIIADSMQALSASRLLRGAAETDLPNASVSMYRRVGVALVSIPSEVDDTTLQNILTSIISLENVRAVEADVVIRLNEVKALQGVPAEHAWRSRAVSNDSAAHELWGMDYINALAALREAGISDDDDRDDDGDTTAATTRGPLVLVSDSGVKADHPDLEANMFRNFAEVEGLPGVDDDGNGYVDDTDGWDAIEDKGTHTDSLGHGTHVAGTIGAVLNNGTGVYGVHPKVQIASCKWIGTDGWGFAADAIECIDYGIAIKAVISNHSYTGGTFLEAMRGAIERAKDAGQLLVAMAGNSGDTFPHAPALYSDYLDNVLAVASITKLMMAGREFFTLSTYSSYDSRVIQIAAPGCHVKSTCAFDEQYCYKSGSDMAAPAVTGAAAVIWSMRPEWTFDKVLLALKSGSKPFVGSRAKVVWGALDVALAVRNVLDDSALQPTTTTALPAMEVATA